MGTRCARALLAGPPPYWSASSASAIWVAGACTAPSLKTTSTSRALRPPLAIDSLGGFCRPPCALESDFGRATTISLICLFRQITGVWITSLLDASGDCGIPPDISRGSPSERLCFAIGVPRALDRNPPARPWVACSVLRVACGPSFRVVPCRFAVSPVGFVGPRAGSRVVL